MPIARIANRHFLGSFLAAVLIFSPEGILDGQDLSVDELNRLGHQAARNGNYTEASGYFRSALEQAEARNASANDLVMILGNLAEMLRSAAQYDEAEKHFNRAMTIFRVSGAV